MPLEGGTFINDLNVSNPLGTDTKAQGDDHLRLIKSVLKSSFPAITKATYLHQAFADVASATTTDLGAVASDNIRITGTTTITSFGTVGAGVVKRVRFAGVLTLTQHATNLILPTAASIVTAADDRLIAISLGAGAWFVLAYNRASGRALVADNVLTLLGLADPGFDRLLFWQEGINDFEWLEAQNARGLAISGTQLKLDDTNLAALTDFDSISQLLVFDAGVAKKIVPKYVPGQLLGVFQHQLSTSTAGGGSTSGSWLTRPLNTEVYDKYAILSLASDQFTISEAGDYVIKWSGAFFGGNANALRLFNVTDSAVVGTSVVGVRVVGSSAGSVPVGIAAVTIAASKAFRIEYQVQTTRATDGLGDPTNFASPEIYLNVEIYRG